jgi:hypothetical protein
MASDSLLISTTILRATFTASSAKRKLSSICAPMAMSPLLIEPILSGPQTLNGRCPKILNSAAAHFEELVALWESIHGQT